MHQPTLLRRLFTLIHRLITAARRTVTVIRLIIHPITHRITLMGQDIALAFPGVMADTGITAVTAITVDMGAIMVAGMAIDKTSRQSKI